MEEKLAKFREKRNKQEQKSVLERLSGQLLALRKTAEKKDDVQCIETEELEEPSQHKSWFIAKCGLWLIIYIILFKYELAGPYLLVSSMALLIYYGTSTGKTRKKTELSAYSVFNPNCVRLEGTLTAEQLEKEILRKPL